MWAALSPDISLRFLMCLVCFLYLASHTPRFSFHTSLVPDQRYMYMLPLLSFHLFRSFCVNLGHLCIPTLSLYGLYFFVHFTPFLLFPLSFPCCLFLSLSNTYISRSISLFFSLPPFISPRTYLIPR